MPICIRPKLAIRRGITALVRDGWGINEISFGSKSVHSGHMKINFYWPLSQPVVMAGREIHVNPRAALAWLRKRSVGLGPLSFVVLGSKVRDF